MTQSEKTARIEIQQILDNISEFGVGMALYELRKIHAECPRKKYFDGKVYHFPKSPARAKA